MPVAVLVEFHALYQNNRRATISGTKLAGNKVLFEKFQRFSNLLRVILN